ncbi:MAG: DUF86 domain-containing protein [Chloroflexi bacterium]|nr:MAG: DUF86 domain-containing protein [Chloroflexota bacterium]
MSHEFLDYIEDIIDAMDKAETAVVGVDYDRFATDFMINFVVIRALEIVGEATKRLPGFLREQYPAIPWRDMAGMRDRIIHGYDTVDLRIVWQVIKQDIPVVKPLLQQILKDYEA